MNTYRVFVTRSALREIKQLPGHVRQRAKRAIDGLETDPRPGDSRSLNLADVATISEVTIEARRIRLDKWRIVYIVTEADQTIDVLAVRKRPPYDYGDLDQILGPAS